MFSLAAVVAVAAMAFIGVSSASATLCKVKQSPCEAANQYPVPSTIVFETVGEKATLAGSIPVKCTSKATLVDEKEEGGKLFGSVTALTWTACEGCKEALTQSPLPTFDDEATGEGNGLAFILNTLVKLVGCTIFNVTCEASAASADLKLTGGTIGTTGTAVANANEDPVVLKGAGCGEKGTWTAKYHIVSVNGATTGSIFEE
jgi:hypothetical protein